MQFPKTTISVLAFVCGVCAATDAAQAQPGWVLSHQKISDTQGGFTGTLDNLDGFGFSVASLGDLDGDGVGDLAVGAVWDDDGSAGPCVDPFFDCNRGAVWVLFLNTNGTVKSHQKISDTQGGFTGTLDDDDRFGRSVTSLGDLDGDGVGDLAVGVGRDDDGGENSGAVWVLFLNTDGTVKSHQKISSTQGGFAGILENGDLFGSSLASLGDLHGDGAVDLAVGAELDDDGGNHRGAVWVLFLDGVPQFIPLPLDIKPGSCPNPFNRHGNGVLPVALAGTVDFDPTEVDLSTLQLSRADGVGGSVAPNEGPPGPHSVLEDVATPFDGEGCECHDLGGDGIDDLSMKFKTRDLVDALELDDLFGGAVVELVLSGSLLDGTPFTAGDCIVIVPPGDLGPINATVGSNVGDTFIEVTPLDLNIDSDGFSNFGRSYYTGTVVTVSAPPTSEGRRFVRWMVEGVLQEIGVRTIEVAVAEDTTLQALY
ncbi:MAG: integrin alpha, partial [Phycisphaerae bacterium]